MLRAARLRGTELVGMAGGALLVVGDFVPWYGKDAANSHSRVDGRTGSLSAWEVHPILRRLLLAAATRSSESARPRKPPGTI